MPSFKIVGKKNLGINIGRVLTATAVIIVATSACYSYSLIRHKTLKNLTNNAFLEAQNKASKIDGWIAKLKHQTEAIANTPTVKTLDWEKIEPYFQKELSRSEAPFKLSLISKDRYLIANTSVGINRKNLRHRKYLKKVLEGQTFVSDAVVSPTTGIRQILISTPIWSTGPRAQSASKESKENPIQPEILGIVNNALTVDLIAEVISSSSSQFGENSYSFVINSDGQVMVHPDPTQRSTQEEPTESLINKPDSDLAFVAQKMIDGKSGIELQTINEKTQYIAYIPLEEANWAIAFMIPRGNVEKNLQGLDLIALSMAMLSISLGAVLWRFQMTRREQREKHRRLIEATNLELEKRVIQRTQELAQAKELAQVTLKSIGDAVLTTDAEGIVQYLNPVAESLTGWSLGQAKGKPIEEVFRIVNEYTLEAVPDPISRCIAEDQIVGLANHTILLHLDGNQFAIEDSAAPIRDGNQDILGAVLVFHDVSEQRRLQKEISHQAQHDALTGLFNRYEFEHRLRQVLDTAKVNDTVHALCYLDLDQFKIVNDTCGHAAGDALLQQLSGLLERKLRQRDVLARLGGDEFGVILENCSLENAKTVANSLRQAVEDFSFSWGDQRFRVGVSIGLATLDATSISVAQILQSADSACYVAKERGRNRIHVYLEDDEVLAQRHGEMKWVSRLQDALEQDHFEIYAQPLIPLEKSGNQGLHCELLLRLVENNHQVTLPGAFMPAAERYSLATHIDQWVINHAFEWLVTHPEILQKLTLCTINLSGHSIGDTGFHAFVVQKLEETKVPASKICFEITETAAIANLAEATQFIQTLQKRGCQFSLDDFGSGLSSFGYLKALPVDFLKIDGLFVKDIVDDPIDLAMVRSINDIAHLLNIKTVAEYVENDDILCHLRRLGVDYGQGFGLGKPQPLSAISKAFTS